MDAKQSIDFDAVVAGKAPSLAGRRRARGAAPRASPQKRNITISTAATASAAATRPTSIQ